MKKLKQFANYAMELHLNEDDVNKIYGPGEIFSCLLSPNAPFHVSIYPSEYNKSVKILGKENTCKLVRIPLDDMGNEKPENQEEIIMHFCNSLDEARSVARQLSCEYLYWSEWDGVRYLAIIDANFNGEISKDPSLVFYAYGED